MNDSKQAQTLMLLAQTVGSEAMQPHFGARAGAGEAPTEHTIAGNVPPCRAGLCCAEHGPGKKPFCKMVLNFRDIF